MILRNSIHHQIFFLFADKSPNIYECPPDEYRKILKENITKNYKFGNDSITDDINSQLKEIAYDISISDRIESMAKRETFVIVKDHKEDFETSPKYRLINPAKSELGKVSKISLDEINCKIRSSTGFNQWRDAQSVIQWFKRMENKAKSSFLSFDIVEFYPSITENLLDKESIGLRNLLPLLNRILISLNILAALSCSTMRNRG